jgi:hypothetical protein
MMRLSSQITLAMKLRKISAVFLNRSTLITSLDQNFSYLDQDWFERT